MTYASQDPVYHTLVAIDGETEEVVEIFQIPLFNLSSFCEQFDVPVQHDPQMLDRYAVGPDDVPFLVQHLAEPIQFDFSAFGYFIEAMKA